MPHYLKSNQLRVLVGNPMEFYEGCRFDHAGNIFQVTLNDKHTFCTTEKPDFSSKLGFGLVNEFDIDNPQSYHNTPVGGRFHKIGVGDLLKEDDLPYDFFRTYEMIPTGYFIEKTKNHSAITFSTKNKQDKQTKTDRINYQKTISVKNNQLLIEYSLQNNEKEMLKTLEYCHNFLSIDKATINNDYRLEFNFDINPKAFEHVHNIGGHLKFDKNELRLQPAPGHDIFIRGVNGKNRAKYWKLTNPVCGCGVKEEISSEAVLVNLWGNVRVLSPELFVKLEILPGQKVHWWRKFTFFEM